MYLFQNLPNQIRTNKQLRLYSTLANKKENPVLSHFNSFNKGDNNGINPWFISGLTDAEGCFVCIVRKSAGHRLGWRVDIVFQIALHKKDLELLKLIQTFFGGIGNIDKGSKDMCAFRVTSLNQILNVIIPHFNKYYLITLKHVDYLLFKKIILLMERGEHLTEEGLQAIVNTRASLNLGLSENLKLAFPKTKPLNRPVFKNIGIPHPEWMAGFISGEGMFFIKINKGRNKAGVGVQLVFQVSQHTRDRELMKSFVTFFKCGQFYNPTQKDWCHYHCTKFSDIYDIIIPFCLQYPIRGIKQKDFLDWVRAAEIIKKGDHLTVEGSSDIINIKAGMNTGRELK